MEQTFHYKGKGETMQKQMVIEVFNFQRQYISLLVDDIPESRMTEMPGKVGTHPAWQLGHMAGSLDGFVEALGGKPRFDEKWKATFGQGSTPVADPKAYPSKSDLLSALDDRRKALVAALEKAPDKTLNTPLANERSRAFFGTVGRYVLFGMLSHDSMHCGQLATWRKAAGLAPALSSVERLLKQPAGV